MPYQNPSSTAIAIVDGDPLVGRTLELALRCAGYDARFQKEDGHSVMSETNPFDGSFRLVLIAPRSSEAYRKALLSRLRGSSRTSSENVPVPVLELITTAGEAL